MTWSYLNPFEKYCHLPKLKELCQERNQWIERASAQKYKKILQSLPTLKRPMDSDFRSRAVKIGKKSDLSPQEYSHMEGLAKELIPWRKGPFHLFDINIDAEWRSDLKWQRIEKAVGNLEHKTVLDIGCNNGYFLFKMAQFRPRLLLGIDPILHVKTQFDFLNHFTQLPHTFFELLGVEHLNLFENMFDTIFSMGIVYHHRHPLQQLLDLRRALRPRGQAIIETIAIPGDGPMALCPPGRYANMKNIYFIPTLNCLKSWLTKTHFTDIEVIFSTPASSQEQRLTPWCPPPHQSFSNFIDRDNPAQTIEGHPAPLRIAVSARKS